MQRADRLFSQFIRLRDGKCLHCGSTEFLQAAHVISRSYKTIRVDPENAIALCRGCHVMFTHNPLAWEDWIEEQWPGRYRRLRAKALTYERVDWKRAHADLKELL